MPAQKLGSEMPRIETHRAEIHPRVAFDRGDDAERNREEERAQERGGRKKSVAGKRCPIK